MRAELKNVKINTPKNGNPPVELKTSKTGKTYAQFTVMESSSRKDPAGQREYGPTKFITCRVFGFDAENLHAAVMGGADRVNVTGTLDHFMWQSNQGPKDDWSMFVESVSLPVPRSQQGGGNFGGQSQQQSDAWNSAPQSGGFPGADQNPPF
jgi:single-strand DNA-binding protein